MAAIIKKGVGAVGKGVGAVGGLIGGGKKDAPNRCLMIGLNNAGKTTILYRLKLGNEATLPQVTSFAQHAVHPPCSAPFLYPYIWPQMAPTIGVNIETIEQVPL